MTDNPWAPGNDGDDDDIPASDEDFFAAFPDSPPSATVPSIDLGATPTITTSSATGRAGRWIAAGLGGALLVGGIGFAVARSGGDEGSPEEAVSSLMAAVADEDVLGMLAALDPGERDTMRDSVEDMATELARLEVVDDSFSLTGIDGIDIEFTDLTFRTEPVRDGLARVHFTGGTATYTADTDELPIGDFVADTMDRFDVEYGGVTETDTQAMGESPDEFLVARRGPEGWRVSLGYTIAEAARREALLAPPNPERALQPLGAETPEGAVEGLIRAATILDVKGMVARLSPHEMRALQEYWPLFVDDADLPTPSDLGVNVTLDRIDLRSDASGDRALVFVDGFAVTVNADGMTVGVDVADGCFELTGDLDEIEVPEEFRGPICEDDLEALLEEAGLSDPQGLPFDIPDLAPTRSVEIGIVTHRVDGGWYVAPIGSSMHVMVAGLQSIDRSHLEAVVDVVESFTGAFLGSFETSFDTGSGFDPGPFGDSGFDIAELPEFDDFGDEFVDGDTIEAMYQLAESFGGDPQDVDCIVNFLLSEGDPGLLEELRIAQETGPEPSQAAQDLFFDAVNACQNG